MKLESCDTFVALKDVTASGKVIFGKNSDRPYGEVQEVVHVAAQKHQKGSKLKVIYIIISIFFSYQERIINSQTFILKLVYLY